MDVTFLQWEYEFSTLPAAARTRWYDDDVTVMAQPTAEPVDNAADSLETRERLAAQNESDDHDMQDVSVAKGDAAVSDEDDIDWDGTVLSEAFTMKQPKHTYVLDNEQTGQQVIVDMGVLLGRKLRPKCPPAPNRSSWRIRRAQSHATMRRSASTRMARCG